MTTQNNISMSCKISQSSAAEDSSLLEWHAEFTTNVFTHSSAFVLNHRGFESSKYAPYVATLYWFIYSVMAKERSWMGVKCTAIASQTA
jgi:hypothetical protein